MEPLMVTLETSAEHAFGTSTFPGPPTLSTRLPWSQLSNYNHQFPQP